MRKLISFLLVIVMALSLCACGECKHKWVDATCTEPKTCELCGVTEGDPLGHDAGSPTYFEDSYCSACGQLVAKKFTPYFVENGLDLMSINMSEYSGSDVGFTTIAFNEPGRDMKGTLTAKWICAQDKASKKGIDTFYIPDFDNCHYYMTDSSLFPTADGYEWRGLHVELKFPSKTNYMYSGLSWVYSASDYYTGQNYSDEAVESNGFEKTKFTINYNGDNYDDCIYFGKSGWKDHGSYLLVSFDEFFRIPVGYDGCAFGVLNAKDRTEEYFNMDHELADVAANGGTFFRLDNE